MDFNDAWRSLRDKEGTNRMTIEAELIDQLRSLHGDVKSYTGANEKRFKQIQEQVDAIDRQRVAGILMTKGGKGIQKLLEENESVQRLMHDKRGKAVLHLEGKDALQLFEQKTTITSGTGGTVGASTSGVLQIQRIPEIVQEARQQLTIRDLLTARPTTFQLIDFVKVNSPMAIASPVAEGSVKAENAVTFTTVSERVKTIATWIPASKQVLEDLSELSGFLKNTLGYYTDLAEEIQLLSGDGTGENLHGLIPQASGFNTALLSASRGWNKIDVIGRAIQQVTAAKELQPTFIVLHPNDWWDVRLTKDSYGRYILGDPQQGGVQASNGFALKMFQAIFGLVVHATTSITAGTFLVGSGSPIAAEIRDRMETVVELSTEHADYFTRNLVAVRAERRLCLVTKRPGSYVTGTFSSSPA